MEKFKNFFLFITVFYMSIFITGCSHSRFQAGTNGEEPPFDEQFSGIKQQKQHNEEKLNEPEDKKTQPKINEEQERPFWQVNDNNNDDDK